jgi:hypothetical protein
MRSNVPAQPAHGQDAAAAGRVGDQLVAGKGMGLPVGAAAPSSVDLERCQVAGPIRARRVARLAANTASPATTASIAASAASAATSQPGCPVG